MTLLTLGVVLQEIYKVRSCLCLLVYIHQERASACIITCIVHTSVAIVVVNIQVMPVLPANEVKSV